MQLDELKNKKGEIEKEIGTVTGKLSDAKCSIPKLEAQLQKAEQEAEIEARRRGSRGSALAEQEAIHEIGLKLEATKESFFQLSADLRDLKADLSLVENAIGEIESQEREEKVRDVVRANKRTFSDYATAQLHLVELQAKDNGLRAQWKEAIVEYENARRKGPAGFDNSNDLYDAACKPLSKRVHDLEKRRDELRSEIIPFEHQVEALREITEKLLAKVQ